MLCALLYTVISTVLLCYLVPTISLDLELKDCPSGNSVNGDYIKIGTKATCTCEDIDEDGESVSWIDSDDSVTENGTDISILALTASSKSKNQTYKCKAGNGSARLTYKPKIAYGPTTVTLRTGSRRFDICGGLTIHLDLDTDSVNPYSPEYTVFQNGTKVPDSGSHQHIKPRKGGILNITCVATNQKFSDLTATSSINVEIREPPEETPTILIKSTSGVLSRNPVEERAASISCQVSGGFPLVDTITLDCGSARPITRSTFEMNATITRDMHGTCICTAEHVTGCYNKRRVVQLNVHYPAEIKSFTANGMTTLEVTENQTVEFACRSEGRPNPEMTLQHVKPQTEDVTNSTGPNLYFQQVMQCNDTGRYVCTAVNSVGEPATCSVNVNVLCTTQLQASSENETTMAADSETAHTFSVYVYGYPEPSSQDLLVQDVCDSEKRDNVTFGYDYDAHYIQDSVGYGQVQISLKRLNETGFRTYFLQIKNSHPGILVYAFTVTNPNGGVDECKVEFLVIVIPAVLTVAIGVTIIVAVICRRRVSSNKEEHVYANVRDVVTSGSQARNTGGVVKNHYVDYEGLLDESHWSCSPYVNMASTSALTRPRENTAYLSPRELRIELSETTDDPGSDSENLEERPYESIGMVIMEDNLESAEGHAVREEECAQHYSNITAAIAAVSRHPSSASRQRQSPPRHCSADDVPPGDSQGSTTRTRVKKVPQSTKTKPFLYENCRC